jgi:hypothetical protein
MNRFFNWTADYANRDSYYIAAYGVLAIYLHVSYYKLKKKFLEL